MGKALREQDTRYSASTYALSEALYEAARKQSSGRATTSRATSLGPIGRASELPQMLYWHRTGNFSLEVTDPRWEDLARRVREAQ